MALIISPFVICLKSSQASRWGWGSSETVANHGVQCIMVCNTQTFATVTSIRLRYCTDTDMQIMQSSKKKNSNDGDDGPMVPTTLYIVTATPTPVPHHLVTWHQDEERPSHWQTQCSSLPLPSSHWQVSSNSAPIPGTSTVEPFFSHLA
jgi:hypothetical protein